MNNGKNILKFTIGMKLILILIILTVTPITLLGLISYQKSQDVMLKKFQVTTEQTISEVNRGIDNYFDKFKEELNILANDVDFKELHIKPENEPYLITIARTVEYNGEVAGVIGKT
jgi:methyl-accepting chemotaxis protein